MSSEWLGNRAIWALGAALRGTARRHEAISANLANAETPGYARADIAFQDALRAALNRSEPGRVYLAATNDRHISTRPASAAEVTPRAVREAGVHRTDGNGVSLDREMALLARNTLQYQALARQLGSRIGMLRTIIMEGRR